MSHSLRLLLRERSMERDLAYEALKIKRLEVERLKMRLAKLRRMQFDRSSERLDAPLMVTAMGIDKGGIVQGRTTKMAGKRHS
jgi:hypothetical protein